MNKIEQTNIVIISGKIVTKPIFKYEKNNEQFYEFFLSSERKSGIKDVLPVICPKILLSDDFDENSYVEVQGEYRSRSVQLENGKNKLYLFIFAKSIMSLLEDLYENKVELIGHIVKKPIFRTTPGGFEITDALIAVNRKYRRSDYIPILCWNRKAKYCADLQVRTKLHIEGRLQSRTYVKDNEEKTAYEVSVFHFNLISEDKND